MLARHDKDVVAAFFDLQSGEFVTRIDIDIARLDDECGDPQVGQDTPLFSDGSTEDLEHPVAAHGGCEVGTYGFVAGQPGALLIQRCNAKLPEHPGANDGGVWLVQ